MSEYIIELKNISKCYTKDTPAVEDISLSVRKGEFVTILGPSGCGKTTILRMIGGFELPTSGQILLNGKDISNLPPNQRPVNTVFQKYALFPYLNIYDNIAFGLKLKKLPKDVIDEKVKHVLEVVDLEGFEDRRIHTLSGGQQQRIAIARAIVNEPEILLLDEPLGALDYKMRKEMQLELKLMHEELGITFLFVTHDQEEALTMSDKIVVMSNGRIQQMGTPEEIYDEPENAFVADFIGESNIFNGMVTGERKASFCGTEFDCVDDFERGTRIQAVIRPEDVILTEPDKGRLQGEIISSIFKGTFHEITVLHGKDEIVAQAQKDMPKGQKVGVDIEPDGIHLMPFNEMENHYIGVIDSELRVRLVDGSTKPDLTPLFPGSKQVDDRLYDEQGREIITEGVKVEVYFNPRYADLSDDPSEGIVQGHIESLIYMGDHYRYVVRSRNDVDYFVYDEYLWNIGDYVSVIIPEEGITYKLAE
ncbi:MAG: ABC transporter ATP-binding protein [Lachnospiraceae bacterium]|nr:ABC transporter ATP-binding protein [Lachnospiraceae bacterium]